MRGERIGFLGAGQMAEAIARGLLEARLCAADALMASDVNEERQKLFRSLGARGTGENLAVVRESDALIVAVKPQNLPELLAEIGPALTRRHLVITICAGCGTALFEAATKEPLRVIRAMPNLPMRVRLGATALCKGRHATEQDLALAQEIFGAAGRAVVVEEGLMDSVTAVSGSGPAYVYFLAEVMIEAGKREGLPDAVARDLAIQTIRGAGEMMLTEGAPPEELRRRVTSKAGTTEAALKVMEERQVREAITDAIAAAAARAREMGKG